MHAGGNKLRYYAGSLRVCILDFRQLCSLLAEFRQARPRARARRVGLRMADAHSDILNIDEGLQCVDYVIDEL